MDAVFGCEVSARGIFVRFDRLNPGFTARATSVV